MKPEEEAIIKVAKEVVLKYIEIGRLPLTNFDEAFRSIYKTITETVRPEKG
ncbi:MAG: conjugal transfer protein TraB [Desulfobacca sp.]|nr:conjugal transfer protein TraB [Desulfobacca sp.]